MYMYITRENFKPCSITCEAYLGYGSSVKRHRLEISKISKLMWKFRKFREIIFGNFQNFQMSEPFIWEISDFQPNLEIFDGIHAFSNGNFHN